MTIDTMLLVAMEHYKKGQLPEAEQLCRTILAQTPENSYALHLLGVIAGQVGRADLAVQFIEKAVALHPGEAFFFCNLAKFCLDIGRFEQAAKAAHAALNLAPKVADSYYNLAIAQQGLGQTDEAAASYLRALELQRNHAQAHANLSNIYKDRGQIAQAIGHLRLAVRYGDKLPLAHSNLVYALLLHPDFSAAALREELRAWNLQHAAPLRSMIQPFTNDKNPDRPLRIGYVSPDFRSHVIGFNLLPLMRQHRKDQFALYLYSGVTAPDGITEQFKSAATHWRQIAGVPDEQVAQQIRDDQIDILVDLSLHLNGNRLLLFARKPAPVQVTFAGYPGSTGLDTMDYRLSDPYLDPPGASDDLYSEKTIRLPHTFWCYVPPSENPAVHDLPASRNQYLTFGCLNNFSKVSEGSLRLWGIIMAQLTASRVILLAAEGPHRRQAAAILGQCGIPSNRVGFISSLPREKYLAAYHQVDIGLDTLPYNGHTTSLDALWMGVPVVTLVGQTIVGRAGYSQLMNLGLPELIAHTPGQFVDIATALARDLPRLTELRRTLRQRLKNSPLGDAPGFAQGIEAAYRQMWQTWCAR